MIEFGVIEARIFGLTPLQILLGIAGCKYGKSTLQLGEHRFVDVPFRRAEVDADERDGAPVALVGVGVALRTRSACSCRTWRESGD